MSSKEYHRILQHTDSEMAHQNKDAHKSGSSGNCRLPQLVNDVMFLNLYSAEICPLICKYYKRGANYILF